MSGCKVGTSTETGGAQVNRNAQVENVAQAVLSAYGSLGTEEGVKKTVKAEGRNLSIVVPIGEKATKGVVTMTLDADVPDKKVPSLGALDRVEISGKQGTAAFDVLFKHIDASKPEDPDSKRWDVAINKTTDQITTTVNIEGSQLTVGNVRSSLSAAGVDSYFLDIARDAQIAANVFPQADRLPDISLPKTP